MEKNFQKRSLIIRIGMKIFLKLIKNCLLRAALWFTDKKKVQMRTILKTIIRDLSKNFKKSTNYTSLSIPVFNLFVPATRHSNLSLIQTTKKFTFPRNTKFTQIIKAYIARHKHNK